jgi:hypothetical protein
LTLNNPLFVGIKATVPTRPCGRLAIPKDCAKMTAGAKIDKNKVRPLNIISPVF